MYVVMIKADEALPWIELNETYRTERGARKAAFQTLETMKIKVVNVAERKKLMKTVSPVEMSF